MPLISACQIPAPRNWQDLEALCVDLWREEWEDPQIQRVGRPGQTQDGVDICARLRNGKWAGIQCKCIRGDSTLLEKDLLVEVGKARGFQPPLSQYMVVTTGLKDAHLESVCRALSLEHVKTHGFSVAVLGWSDVCLLLERNPSVARRHFPFVITSVGAIVLINDGNALDVAVKELHYSFSREEFIHPRIVEELLGYMSDSRETVVSVDLSSSNNSNRFYGDFLITHESGGPWVRFTGEPTQPFGREPYFQYKHLGTSESGIHILRTMQGGGGTGHFNDLIFLTLQKDSGVAFEEGLLATRDRLLLKTLGSIPIGDRYAGAIEFKSGVLNIGKDQNSFGCLKEGFSIQVA